VTAPAGVPEFARALLDDAAMFPPGLAPLAEAVPAHRRHESAPYAGLVGPLVAAADALDELAGLLPAGDGPRLPLTVTVPGGPAAAAAALARAAALPVDLRAVEVAVPDGMGADRLLAELDRAGFGEGVHVYVEVPRDERRPGIIAALAATRYRAKFRTGGVRAELYPGEAELARAVKAAVDAGVPFKATAGLHHAVRNTDPRTGFEQHGFLNLLLATDAALRGAGEDELARVLAERDGAAIAARVAGLGDERARAVREAFVSFGTCSIAEPLTDLVRLGLLPPEMSPTQEGTA